VQTQPADENKMSGSANASETVTRSDTPAGKGGGGGPCGLRGGGGCGGGPGRVFFHPRFLFGLFEGARFHRARLAVAGGQNVTLDYEHVGVLADRRRHTWRETRGVVPSRTPCTSANGITLAARGFAAMTHDRRQSLRCWRHARQSAHNHLPGRKPNMSLVGPGPVRKHCRHGAISLGD